MRDPVILPEAILPETENIRCRHAGEADLERLLVLARRTFEETFAPFNSPANMAHYMARAFSVESVRQELENPHNLFMLFEQQNDEACPVGYFKLQRAADVDREGGPASLKGKRAVFLERFYVDSAFHGKGVAQAMMACCLSLCEQFRYEVIWLGVWEHNARALAFYKKFGFEKAGSHLFEMGSDTQTDFWLTRTV